MNGAVAALLPGDRLHLHHGPIDLVIGADGDREAAFRAASARFRTVLSELVPELRLLRQPVAALPEGAIARTMHRAALPHADGVLTPMAAVAGAVAQTVLAAMVAAVPLRRAYVNNGGDIALHLTEGARFDLAVASPMGADLGRARVTPADPARGVATSGAGGRSLSFGIADAVTVLADSAAGADVAATLIANAVTLPGHPAIATARACDLDPDSDLRAARVVTDVGRLSPSEVSRALARGRACAQDMRARGLIHGAALFLRGQSSLVGGGIMLHAAEKPPMPKERAPSHA